MSPTATLAAEMQRALEADGEKLRQLTGEDHGPWFYDDAAGESHGPFYGPYEPLALTGEQLSTLASIVHDLREHSNAIREGIAKHGSYNVPWNVLSWGKDMAAQNAERIEAIIGDTCRQCGGRGIIDNPEARYERDRDTGNMETNDPEEIDCDRCNGTGLEPEKRPEPASNAEEEIAF